MAVNSMIDAWVQNVGSLCWAQDQSEAFVRSWMDQGQLAREEGRQLSVKMAEQAKANQAELQKFIHNAVALSVESLHRSHQAQIDALQARLDEMTEMMEKLTKTS